MRVRAADTPRPPALFQRRGGEANRVWGLADPLVQRAFAREVRLQELHLIAEDATTLQVDVLGMGRREGNGQQLDTCLLRGAACLVVIATLARCDDIVPRILTALAQRGNVVPRQGAIGKALAAV